MYRRFVITGPDCTPAFLEGEAMTPGGKELATVTAAPAKIHGKQDSEVKNTEALLRKASERTEQQMSRSIGTDAMWISAPLGTESSLGWKEGVIELLQKVPY